MSIRLQTITAVDDATYRLTFAGDGDEVGVTVRLDGLSVETSPDILMYSGADVRAIVQAVTAFQKASQEQIDWPQTPGRPG
jgi:hypothetical protein